MPIPQTYSNTECRRQNRKRVCRNRCKKNCGSGGMQYSGRGTSLQTSRPRDRADGTQRCRLPGVRPEERPHPSTIPAAAERCGSHFECCSGGIRTESKRTSIQRLHRSGTGRCGEIYARGKNQGRFMLVAHRDQRHIERSVRRHRLLQTAPHHPAERDKQLARGDSPTGSHRHEHRHRMRHLWQRELKPHLWKQVDERNRRKLRLRTKRIHIDLHHTEHHQERLHLCHCAYVQPCGQHGARCGRHCDRTGRC